MALHVIMIRRRLVLLACLGLLGASGCGDSSGLPERYPVSGTVTYQGKPVERGVITFDPVSPDARTATGTIENGSYSLTTAVENDGALPGQYRVTIVASVIDYSQVQAKAAGGAGRQTDIVKASAKAKPLVPPKYSLPDTSGLTYEVKEQSNTANFDLTD